MIVAVISTYTVADDPLPANIGVPLATGSYLSLLVALGQEEGERLALHYDKLLGAREQNVCSGKDVAEPEFHLHDIVGISDPLYLFASERLVCDDYIARKCANAPDVLILCGDFVDEVADWEAEAFASTRDVGTPLRLIDVAARAVYAACSGQYSIAKVPASDCSGPMVIVTTHSDHPWFKRLRFGREVYL